MVDVVTVFGSIRSIGLAVAATVTDRRDEVSRPRRGPSRDRLVGHREKVGIGDPSLPGVPEMCVLALTRTGLEAVQ
ncbi:MAG: hypothetical protein L0H84_02130 [Pseudonocardia sp.]|nr:hypothetical protein [Pseudonocardia sp.]